MKFNIDRIGPVNLQYVPRNAGMSFAKAYQEAYIQKVRGILAGKLDPNTPLFSSKPGKLTR